MKQQGCSKPPQHYSHIHTYSMEMQVTKNKSEKLAHSSTHSTINRKHKQDRNQHIWIITVHLFTTDKDTSSQIHTDVFDTKLKHKWSKKLITVLMHYNMFWCLFISRGVHTTETTIQEALSALKQMKNDKGSRLDGRTAEFVKFFPTVSRPVYDWIQGPWFPQGQKAGPTKTRDQGGSSAANHSSNSAPLPSSPLPSPLPQIHSTIFCTKTLNIAWPPCSLVTCCSTKTDRRLFEPDTV